MPADNVSDRIFTGAEGFGSTVLVELSREELLDIRSALAMAEGEARDGGRRFEAEDYSTRRERLDAPTAALRMLDWEGVPEADDELIPGEEA